MNKTIKGEPIFLETILADYWLILAKVKSFQKSVIKSDTKFDQITEEE